MKRKARLIIPAILAAAGMVFLANSAGAVTASASTRSVNLYLVHGYNAGSCGSRWNADIAQFRKWGWTGRMHTVGYYARDTSCSDHIAGKGVGEGTSINQLGKDLANYIYRNHSRKHQTVDLVGHSMGGLVIRAALAGVSGHKSGFPPYLYVANAVTMETPHQGVNTNNWRTCAKGNVQCREMNPRYKSDYSFVKQLQHAPQGRGGTDWSLIGATDDQTVSWSSGVDLNHAAQHKYHYLAGQGLGHSVVREAIAHNHKYRLSYWNAGMKHATHTTHGWSPVYAVFQACRYSKAW